jgi:hypothetical protein
MTAPSLIDAGGNAALKRWADDVTRALEEMQRKLDQMGNTAAYATFTNLTTDRTCDANATSTAELADILGTLIVDLKMIGVLKP